MEKFIKYKRITKTLNEEDFDDFFDELIRNGWNIIYYTENTDMLNNYSNNSSNIIQTSNPIKVTIVVGKHNNFI